MASEATEAIYAITALPKLCLSEQYFGSSDPKSGAAIRGFILKALGKDETVEASTLETVDAIVDFALRSCSAEQANVKIPSPATSVKATTYRHGTCTATRVRGRGPCTAGVSQASYDGGQALCACHYAMFISNRLATPEPSHVESTSEVVVTPLVVQGKTPVICLGTKKDGTACRAHARTGEKYCGWHVAQGYLTPAPSQ